MASKGDLKPIEAYERCVRTAHPTHPAPEVVLGLKPLSSSSNILSVRRERPTGGLHEGYYKA